jgi:ActR/RegA family two-component response regulator
MHLLLVEDEDAIRSALARGLASGGNTVDAAASLAEGRAKAAARRPDALVTDLKLPDGLGLDLAEELGVPFVQMTGYGTFDDAVRAIHLGCVEFFTKPVALRDLRRAIERIAGRISADAGLRVLDPELQRLLRVDGDRPETRTFVVTAADWTADTRPAAFATLAFAAPCLRHRQVLAELLHLVPTGRLVLNRDDRRWLAWLDVGDLIPDGRDHADARSLLGSLTQTVRWLADGGVLAEVPLTVPELAPGEEWLLPRELPASGVLDLAAVSAVGTWIHDWFRAHPGHAVVGARVEVRRQLEHAGLPVLFRDPRSVGVTAQERSELFG